MKIKYIIMVLYRILRKMIYNIYIINRHGHNLVLKNENYFNTKKNNN